MGKGNRAIVEMLYYGVEEETIQTACQYVYTYRIREQIREFKGETLFIYGSNESYPRKSAQLLKFYLPNLNPKEIKNMGHGQFLYSFPESYARLLLHFLNQ